jgi:hypothetical protein
MRQGIIFRVLGNEIFETGKQQSNWERPLVVAALWVRVFVCSSKLERGQVTMAQ